MLAKNTNFRRGLASSRMLHHPGVRRRHRHERDLKVFRLGVAAAEADAKRKAEREPRGVPWTTKTRLWLRRKTGIPF